MDNRLVQNQIEIRQLKIIMKLNSIEGIKTAVSLGLGAAFVSSSTLVKEIELQTIKILNIKNIRINRTLSIISNPNCYKSNVFKVFYNEFDKLKLTIEN